MKIINRQIEELIAADYNPRRLSEKQFKDLEASFSNLGTLEPAVINMHPDRLNIIISGHQRIKVAKKLGLSEYPCVEVKFDLDKEKEANIRMNKNGGDWDHDLLGSEFEIEDLTEWGFDDLFDDEEPEEKKEIKPECEFTEELFESHNYVVLYFDNELDWQTAVEKLKIETVKTPDSKPNYMRAGIGRVLKGSEVIERLED